MDQSQPEAGRPQRDTENARSVADVERLLLAEAETLTRRLLDAALENDRKELGACANRLLLRRDWRKNPFKLPKMDAIGDHEPALAAVCEGVRREELTLCDALDLVAFIGSWADLRRTIGANKNLAEAAGRFA